ncbi:GNAT family N-acetyltransferase [Carboxylicivirga taeanensis]|uniref:GNAT family N-acetyltransferase n=1 Tax=Carboxylicivirga taeanensis TaxID=1416875 RepID=UPI003F6DECEA
MEIGFDRLSQADGLTFNRCWKLYTQAFPEDERRELDVQNKIMASDRYHFEAVFYQEQLAGFILWWQFDGLLYIEHLATFESLRGKGLGKMIIEGMQARTKDLLILEVEPPVNELNQRRINFYSRLGLVLNSYNYQQPPLRRGGEAVELLLMSFPQKMSQSQLEKFKEQFNKHCYLPVLSDLI